MTFRKATAADAAAIYDIVAKELGYTWDVTEIAQTLTRLQSQSEHYCLCCVEAGEVIGFIHACDYQTLYAPRMTDILGIAVRKSYHGAGIGRALITHAEEWAKSRGSLGVRLNSGAERTEAHKFYRAVGYQWIKNQANFRKVFADEPIEEVNT